MKQTEIMNHVESLERDGVIRFINELCDLKENAQVKASDLYGAYLEWCEDNAYWLGRKRFVNLLREETASAGHSISAFRTDTYRGWQGITVKTGTVTGTEVIKKNKADPDVLCIEQFVSTMCALQAKEYTTGIDLYKSYIEWVVTNYPRNPERRLGTNSFTSKLRFILKNQGADFDYGPYKGRGWFRGIKLKTPNA